MISIKDIRTRFCPFTFSLTIIPLNLYYIISLFSKLCGHRRELRHKLLLWRIFKTEKSVFHYVSPKSQPFSESTFTESWRSNNSPKTYESCTIKQTKSIMTATYNCRSLLIRKELENETSNINLNTIGLAEERKKGEQFITLPSRKTLLYSEHKLKLPFNLC